MGRIIIVDKKDNSTRFATHLSYNEQTKKLKFICDTCKEKLKLKWQILSYLCPSCGFGIRADAYWKVIFRARAEVRRNLRARNAARPQN